MLIAFFFHVPGLWICGTRPLPRGLLRPNLLALGATVLAVVGGGLYDRRAALVAFLAGHAAWGLFLCHRVRQHDPAGARSA